MKYVQKFFVEIHDAERDTDMVLKLCKSYAEAATFLKRAAKGGSWTLYTNVTYIDDSVSHTTIFADDGNTKTMTIAMRLRVA